MVLVDTSIWIDFLQHPASQHADRLEDLIREHNRATVCGIILQEVLQGIRDRRSYTAAKERLTNLPYLDMNMQVYLEAASLYRSLRAQGITVPSADTSIAALAILNRIPLYTRDRHFGVIAELGGLVLYS
ncbi:MAG TPA: PIN domain nuclease [Nitrospiraceae bacterium]|nr:PIN domain nuclease [Nitrospiraceae bacterium]